MKVYVLILQKPLRVKSYTSLVALIEDNNIEDLGASKSKLEKWNWSFDYIAHKVVISQTEALTAGDVRRKKEELKEEYLKEMQYFRGHFFAIKKIVSYINREIQQHELPPIIDVRNLEEAHANIIKWNKEVDQQIDVYKKLQNTFPTIEPCAIYKIHHSKNSENSL